MNPVAGGVCAPKGYTASGVTAHIKDAASDKKDCALIVSDEPAVVAGTFTTNRLKSPPVRWTEGVCARRAARAVFVNSGNANACTGALGAEDAQRMAEKVSLGLGVPATEVCVSSTGVIGVPLPMDRIEQGIDACLAALSAEGSPDAALAIMTTDTVPKEMAVEVPLSGGTVRIGAIAKGSGMIAPNMATLICLLTTDAAIEFGHLRPLLKECVEASFNRICIDNDMSTSDMVLCLANGAAGLPTLAPNTEDFEAFSEALKEICVMMAQTLVRDGEGATKFIEITVEGAGSDADAKTIARSIGMSQLCKTAFFGEDPNWGRIACAAGYAGVDFEARDLSISLEGLEVVREGLPTDYEEAEAVARMKGSDLHVYVRVGNGPGSCVFWTSDLSHAYVDINAEYRT